MLNLMFNNVPIFNKAYFLVQITVLTKSGRVVLIKYIHASLSI